MTKFRLPRKIKKQIPKGHYCYKHIRFSGFVQLIKSCHFYGNILIKDKPEHLKDEIDKEFPDEIIGWCKLFKCDVDDQCKSCSIKL